jgi:hypothetical protein
MVNAPTRAELISRFPIPYSHLRLTMKLAARTVLIALPLLGSLAVLSAVGCTAPITVTVPGFTEPARAKAADLKNAPVGMSGCLGAACHGGPATQILAGRADKNTWQGSGSCWAAADPHTAAYSLLTDHPHRPVKVTAKHIMARYAPGTEATNDARCVACHTNPALATPERMNDPHARAMRAEGVSCEACHGSAGGWVTEHTTWTTDRRQMYAKTGMVPLFDLGERALTCAGCHVGAPADPNRGLPVRDMNHDMIAAGHPRLNFDFAEYMRRLPVHWQEKDRTTSPPTPRVLNPVKVWLVGRAAHGEAACQLLASRAERSPTDVRTPWPEFAEFNCAACHHNLRAATDDTVEAQWRKEPVNLAGRPIGATSWQTVWPLTDAPGLDAPKRDKALLGEVSNAMSVSRPNRAAIPALAKRVAGEVMRWRVQVTGLKDDEIGVLARRLIPPVPPRVPEWDSAAQLFFGLAAQARARPGAADLVPEFRKAAAALRTDDWPHAKWTEVDDALEAIQKKP